MGHVDHGKTTLLDALRHTSVAAGEAGGITQHIGAFSVPLSSLVPASADTPPTDTTITFLDTPGHAAFTAMRARGASVTDIVVLVVAADDGVMPQTREVLELVKSEGDKVGLVVAINKVDKPGVDVVSLPEAREMAVLIHRSHKSRVLWERKAFSWRRMVETRLVSKYLVLRNSVSMNLSRLFPLSPRLGIYEPELEERPKATSWSLMSIRGEGEWKYLNTADVSAVATVLITRGILRQGDCIIAGHTFCRVRQMRNDKGEDIQFAGPGTPISMSGWRDLPTAGDSLLQSPKGEEEAKRAVNNRIREAEAKKTAADAEIINVKRREERAAHESRTEQLKAVEQAGGNLYLARQEADRKARTSGDTEIKELRLVIKGDVSGTVEAVEGALSNIGNKEAKVHIIHTGVGEVNESDVDHAEASDGEFLLTDQS
jgi:translation initiation factor IF-2